MNRQRKLVSLAVIFFLIIALSACKGQTGDVGGSKEKYDVMATSTMLTDLAKIIGGDKAEVNGLMAAGVDPHLYQPSAGDVSYYSSFKSLISANLYL